MKKTIRLTEQDLHNLISEAINELHGGFRGRPEREPEGTTRKSIVIGNTKYGKPTRVYVWVSIYPEGPRYVTDRGWEPDAEQKGGILVYGDVCFYAKNKEYDSYRITNINENGQWYADGIENYELMNYKLYKLLVSLGMQSNNQNYGVTDYSLDESIRRAIRKYLR